MNGHPVDEHDALLERLRRWLDETRAEAGDASPEHDPDPDDDAEGPPVGLYRLVEEFTALRQEVKLQTKGGRALQEQAEALLPALRQAIEQFRAVEPKGEEAVQAAGRPLAAALADLDEALERSRLEVDKAKNRLDADPVVARLDAFLASQSWLRRWRSRAYHNDLRAVVGAWEQGPRAALFAALVEGHDLVQARLRRVLASEQIRRIDCVGNPVDPERMTVVAMLDAPDRPPGTVVDELRRGYTWRGRLLRYAEVRAARAPVAT
jgi:molecular chaperone GrpE